MEKYSRQDYLVHMHDTETHHAVTLRMHPVSLYDKDDLEYIYRSEQRAITGKTRRDIEHLFFNGPYKYDPLACTYIFLGQQRTHCHAYFPTLNAEDTHASLVHTSEASGHILWAPSPTDDELLLHSLAVDRNFPHKEALQQVLLQDAKDVMTESFVHREKLLRVAFPISGEQTEFFRQNNFRTVRAPQEEPVTYWCPAFDELARTTATHTHQA